MTLVDTDIVDDTLVDTEGIDDTVVVIEVRRSDFPASAVECADDILGLELVVEEDINGSVETVDDTIDIELVFGRDSFTRLSVNQIHRF